MNGKTKPYAILVFGAPMSGKTTFANQFSNKFNAPFLNFSDLRERFHISRKLALVLLSEIIKCKQNILIEGALDSEKQREEIRQILIKAGYEPIMVWVQTDVVAIKHRMRKKYKTLTEAKAALDSSYKHIEAPDETEDYIVISGKHTFATQCKNVLTGLSKHNQIVKK